MKIQGNQLTEMYYLYLFATRIGLLLGFECCYSKAYNFPNFVGDFNEVYFHHIEIKNIF